MKKMDQLHLEAMRKECKLALNLKFWGICKGATMDVYFNKIWINHQVIYYES